MSAKGVSSDAVRAVKPAEIQLRRPECVSTPQLFELDGIVARAQKQSYCCVSLRSLSFPQY
jgi:hypothetical protein